MFSCFAFPASRRVTVHLKLFRPFKSLLSCFLQRFHRTYIWLGNPIGIACFTFALALFFNSLSLTFALVLLFHSLSFQACPYSCINSYKFYVYSQHRAHVFQRTGARIDTTAANGDAGCLAVELPSRHGRPAHDKIYLSAQRIKNSAPVFFLNMATRRRRSAVRLWQCTTAACVFSKKAKRVKIFRGFYSCQN